MDKSPECSSFSYILVKFTFRTSDSISGPPEDKISCKILPESLVSDEADSDEDEDEDDGDSDALADGVADAVADADATEVKPFKISLPSELSLPPAALVVAFEAAELVGPSLDDCVTSPKIEPKSSPPLSLSTGTALARPEAVINAIKYPNFIVVLLFLGNLLL